MIYYDPWCLVDTELTFPQPSLMNDPGGESISGSRWVGSSGIRGRSRVGAYGGCWHPPQSICKVQIWLGKRRTSEENSTDYVS